MFKSKFQYIFKPDINKSKSKFKFKFITVVLVAKSSAKKPTQNLLKSTIFYIFITFLKANYNFLKS